MNNLRNEQIEIMNAILDMLPSEDNKYIINQKIVGDMNDIANIIQYNDRKLVRLFHNHNWYHLRKSRKRSLLTILYMLKCLDVEVQKKVESIKYLDEKGVSRGSQRTNYYFEFNL